MQADNNYHCYALFAAYYVSETMYSLYREYKDSPRDCHRSRALYGRARSIIMFDRVVGSMYGNHRDQSIIKDGVGG